MNEKKKKTDENKNKATTDPQRRCVSPHIPARLNQRKEKWKCTQTVQLAGPKLLTHLP